MSRLWSESVAAGVLAFLMIGPPLVDRLGPALAAVQGLHGLTFALFHLSAMRVIGTVVPERLGAAAQALHGNVVLGVASAALTLLAGTLFAGLGLRACWAMAGLCVLALPLARGLSPRIFPPENRVRIRVDKPCRPL